MPSRPPRCDETTSPERDTPGRFWNRWNDSKMGEPPLRNSRRERRRPRASGSFTTRSTAPSRTSNATNRTVVSLSAAAGSARAPRLKRLCWRNGRAISSARWCVATSGR